MLPEFIERKTYPLITVIVPVYQTLQYLPKCIDSILSQTYKNLEIFLVNDGSPDSCGELCDAYQQRDKRIRTIHKTNGGLSSARNAALDEMNGEYVTFIDSDDYVESNYIEMLYDVLDLRKVQISVCNEQRFQLNGEEEKLLDSCYPKDYKNLTIPAIKGIEEFLYQEVFDTSACGKLYESRLFKGIRFPLKKTFEDLATIYQVFLKAKNIAYIPERLYYYLQRHESMVHQTDIAVLITGIQIAEGVCKELAVKAPAVIKAGNCRLLSMCFHTFFLLSLDMLSNAEANMVWQKIKKLRLSIILDPKARKKTKGAAFLSYIGKDRTWKLGARVLTKYNKKRAV